MLHELEIELFHVRREAERLLHRVVIAIAVVVIGGIGSILGSLIVAHIIGFMETITTTVIAAELRGVFTMAMIIIVLIVAPKGLFGREEL